MPDISITELYKKLRHDLLAYVHRKTGNAEDAEELVQDAFYQALDTRKDVSSLDNPAGYLYRTAYNLAMNRMRKHRHHQQYIAGQHVEEAGPSLEQGISAAEDLSQLACAFRKMPRRTRHIFALSRMEELSYQEISQQLSVSVSSVEKHMIKALRQLREASDQAGRPGA